MRSVSSRIWTRVAVSISYDDNHYANLLLSTKLEFVPHFLKFWFRKTNINSIVQEYYAKKKPGNNG